MMTDPTRLLDDPSIAASLRADLAQAKSAGLVGFDAAAGAASLQAAIAAEATTATATAASAGVSKGFVIGLVGVVSAGAVALITLRSPEPEPLAAVVPPVPVIASEDPAPQDESLEEDAEPEPSERAEVPEPVVVEVVEPEQVEVVPPEPRVERPKASESKVERPSDDYVREAKLIADARRALKREPARALEILEEAETAFPRGLLREEREALTILSLDGLGRTTEAQSRGRQFIDAHGKSPYADAVRQVLH